MPMNTEEPLPSDSEGDAKPTQSPDDTDGPLVIRSHDILQGHREVWIEHGDDMYRLRVTSAGKLYLTK